MSFHRAKKSHFTAFTPPTGSATQAALHCLTRRALSSLELQSKLQQQGHAAPDIARAVQQMQRYGYVDDAALARACVSTARRRGRGPAWVRQTLQRRQVDATLAQDAASQLHADDAAASHAALALLQARFTSLPAAPSPDFEDLKDLQRQLQRALRFLQGRGFTGTSAYEALRQWQARQGHPDLPLETEF